MWSVVSQEQKQMLTCNSTLLYNLSMDQLLNGHCHYRGLFTGVANSTSTSGRGGGDPQPTALQTNASASVGDIISCTYHIVRYFQGGGIFTNFTNQLPFIKNILKMFTKTFMTKCSWQLVKFFSLKSCNRSISEDLLTNSLLYSRHTKQLNWWPKSSASCVVDYSRLLWWYCCGMYVICLSYILYDW